MSSACPPVMNRRTSLHPVSLLAVVVALTVYAWINRNGLLISPDGWGYWQGSVSLLYGRGYHYFFADKPISEWPPLYAVYLCGWQKLAGVSGASLWWANFALAGVAAAGWAWLGNYLVDLAELVRVRRIAALLGVIAISGIVVAGQFRYLLSDNLKLALAPWFILAALALRAADSKGHVARCAIGLWAAATLLLLNHNSSIVLVAAACVIVILRKPLFSARLLACVVACAVAMATWVIVRKMLHQDGSHRMGLGVAPFTPMQYIRQLMNGLAFHFGSTRLVGSAVLALLAVLYLWATIRTYRTPASMPATVVPAVALSLLVLAGTFALFNLIQIAALLADRFISIPILLLLLAAVACAVRLSNSSALAVVIAMVVVAAPCVAIFRNDTLPAAPNLQYVDVAPGENGEAVYLKPDWEIRPDVTGQPPQKSQGRTILAPPRYPWLRA